MARYYAHITGAANISTDFRPFVSYTGNGNYLRIEYAGNVTTNATTYVYVWKQTSVKWFSLEQGSFEQYLNLGSTTYVPDVNNTAANRRKFNSDNPNNPAVFDLNNGTANLTFNNWTTTGTYDGGFPNNGIVFFPTRNAKNLIMDFYEFKVYGANNTLLFDYVPDYDGTIMGLRDKVSGTFYTATDQSKIQLFSLTTFEIQPEEEYVLYTSGTTTIALTAGEGLTWTASTSDSWLSLSPSTGSGDGSVEVTYAKNATFQDRTGTVTFTSSEGDVLTFTIEQEKKPTLVYDRPIYRSGNLVKKMYRSGELIYLRLNPPSPPAPGPVLPSNTFLVNYNAKFYNSSTYTIPKTEGQLFNEDMVLNAAASSYTSDHITVNGQYFDYIFPNNGSNPFNRSSTDSLTVIMKAKPSSLTSGAHSLFSNRGGSYNWMVFNPANGSPAGMFFLHTSDGNYNNVPSVQARNLNEPNIFAFRVSSGTGYGHSYTDNETFSTKNISWGGITNSVHFLGGSSSSEYWDGDFYWMYISTEALTDDEIQQVIDYNENINPTNE